MNLFKRKKKPDKYKSVYNTDLRNKYCVARMQYINAYEKLEKFDCKDDKLLSFMKKLLLHDYGFIYGDIPFVDDGCNNGIIMNQVTGNMIQAYQWYHYAIIYECPDKKEFNNIAQNVCQYYCEFYKLSQSYSEELRKRIRR